MGLEDDPLYEHRIAKTLKRDFENVMSSEYINQFHQRNEYKSAKTKKADEDLVNYLLGKLKQYSHGWIQCNANKTAELWNKSRALDDQLESLRKEANLLNDLINQMIVIVKDKLPYETLKSLRELEIKYRELK